MPAKRGISATLPKTMRRLLPMLLLAACAPISQRAAVHWQPSPNFDERRPNFVIIHHTSDDTVRQALGTLTNPARAASAHYLIARDGTVYQLVAEAARAWHAGESKWGANSDINSSSLGIELDNNGREPFPDAQIAALLVLLADIEQRLHIPKANFLGHADVAPKRKADPSRYFPWRLLAERGFGLWCDPSLLESAPAIDPISGPMSDPMSDPITELQALGYDTSDVAAAVRAFKLHFGQDEPSVVLTDRDRALLHCLLRDKSR